MVLTSFSFDWSGSYDIMHISLYFLYINLNVKAHFRSICILHLIWHLGFSHQRKKPELENTLRIF